jgi:hypothetical protein
VRRALAAVFALAGCAAPAEDDAIVIRRVEARVEVRRAGLAIDVAAGARIALTATWPGGALAIDAAATGPGVPITASVHAGDGALEIRNDLVIAGDATYRLSVASERDAVVGGLDPALAAALAEVAPYREAIEARLAEAAPVFAAVGLFQAWPGGVEPAWPRLEDPRDATPPGQLAGDVTGLGMTCASDIRCPDSAPFCVTRDHGQAFGVCTRACADDAACGAGHCTQPVIDIPDVTGAVLTCELDCATSACPGRLACSAETLACEAVQPSP